LCLSCAPLRVSCSSPLPPSLSSTGLAPSCFAAGRVRAAPAARCGRGARSPAVVPWPLRLTPVARSARVWVWAVCSPPYPYSLSPSRVSLAGSRPLCAPLLRIAWWCPPLPPPSRRLVLAFAPLPCFPLLSPFHGLIARLRVPSARLLFPPARFARGSSFLPASATPFSPPRCTRAGVRLPLLCVPLSRVACGCVLSSALSAGIGFRPGRPSL
jgi:hypothetical protein